MKELDNLLQPHRNTIDRLDAEILALINQRYKEVLAIGEIKKAHQAPVFVPGREKALLQRLHELNTGPLLPNTLEALWREIMSGARQLEKPTRIAFLGPEGTFSHQAVHRRFGHSVETLACPSIPDVFTQVENCNADYGCVPVENSTEGTVSHTLDWLRNSKLEIVSEVYLNIHHLLLRAPEFANKPLKRIYSHQQVFGQCRGFLLSHYAQVELVECASTTAASKLAMADEEGAAIAGRLAAELFKLQIIAENIEDIADNTTRFLVLSRNGNNQVSDKAKTSLYFVLKDRPGALYEALAPLQKNGISMSMIESRPLKENNWQYCFFVDILGDRNASNIAEACAELNDLCQRFRILGCYPEGEISSN